MQGFRDSPLSKTRETHNHNIFGFRRDLWRTSVLAQNPAQAGLFKPRLLKIMFRRLLKIFKDRDFTPSLGNVYPCLVTHRKKSFSSCASICAHWLFINKGLWTWFVYHLLHLEDNQTWKILERTRRHPIEGVIMLFYLAVTKVYDEMEGKPLKPLN